MYEYFLIIFSITIQASMTGKKQPPIVHTWKTDELKLRRPDAMAIMTEFVEVVQEFVNLREEADAGRSELREYGRQLSLLQEQYEKRVKEIE